jgi:hypothetical protein
MFKARGIGGNVGDKMTFDTFEAIAGNRRIGLHFSKVMHFVSATIKQGWYQIAKQSKFPLIRRVIPENI